MELTNRNLATFSDSELDGLISKLHLEIYSHDSKIGDGEIMLKNAFLINSYNSEKQKRNTDKAGRQSMRIAYIALGISVASLLISFWQSTQETTINPDQMNRLIESINKVGDQNEILQEIRDLKNGNNDRIDQLIDVTTNKKGASQNN